MRKQRAGRAPGVHFDCLPGRCGQRHVFDGAVWGRHGVGLGLKPEDGRNALGKASQSRRAADASEAAGPASRQVGLLAADSQSPGYRSLSPNRLSASDSPLPALHASNGCSGGARPTCRLAADLQSSSGHPAPRPARAQRRSGRHAAAQLQLSRGEELPGGGARQAQAAGLAGGVGAPPPRLAPSVAGALNPRRAAAPATPPAPPQRRAHVPQTPCLQARQQPPKRARADENANREKTSALLDELLERETRALGEALAPADQGWVLHAACCLPSLRCAARLAVIEHTLLLLLTTRSSHALQAYRL